MSMFETALMNTVLGMGTVFVELIFMSFVIGSLKYISQLQGNKRKKPQPIRMEPPMPTRREAPRPAPANVVNKTMGDAELAAVITAAVAAYQSEAGTPVPADGLVVRSIRKRSYK